MLLPKRVKYRRVHRGRLKGKATRGNTVTYGDFGLQALEPAWITSNQIEAARVAMTRYTKRGGKVWIYKGEVLNTTLRAAAPEPARRDRRNGDRRDRRNGDRRNGDRRGGDRNFNRREGGNR